MNKKQLLLVTFTILIHVLCISIGLSGLTDINLFLHIIGAIMLVYTVYVITGNFSNIVFIFVAFSVLYGLGGPITQRYGEGISKIFGNEFYIDKFLMAYDLATIGMVIGIVLYDFISQEKNQMVDLNIRLDSNDLNVKRIINISLFVSILTGLFEIINFLNVGGISTLIQGKAIYQAAIANLTLALPVDMLACLSFALMSLTIAICKKNNKHEKFKIILSILAMLPYFLIELLLGKRGNLLSLMLIVFLGLTYFKPLEKISKKIVLIGLIAYLVMAFLYANRGIVSLLFKDPTQFVQKAFLSERIISAINPRGWRASCSFWKLQYADSKK